MTTKQTYFKILLASLLVCFSQTLFAGEMKTKTELFQALSDAGVTQVIELQWNYSMVSKLGDKVKIHNIVQMQDHPLHPPKPNDLGTEYQHSQSSEDPSLKIPELFYKTGDGDCDYLEAIQVSEALVCYARLIKNPSYMTTRKIPRCIQKRANGRLSHCFVFAQSIDDVVEAISLLPDEHKQDQHNNPI